MRSNGVVTYVGKDIAYQFWKLGLLGRDFHYRVFADRPHGPLWATCSVGRRGRPSGVRRRCLRLQRHRRQAVVPSEAAEAGARRRRPSRGRERSHHFSYEMVALSHATARELGYRAGARFGGRQTAFRRGVGAQGPRRQGRRPARYADAKCRAGSRNAQPGAERQPSANGSRR